MILVTDDKVVIKKTPDTEKLGIAGNSGVIKNICYVCDVVSVVIIDEEGCKFGPYAVKVAEVEGLKK